MASRSLVTAATALLTAAVLTGGSSQAAPANGEPDATVQAERVARSAAEDTRFSPRVAGVQGRRVEVVAVGDIACAAKDAVTSTTCRHAEVAKLTKRIDPKAVLALGDLQYHSGSLSAFRNSYDKSWGDLKSITYPTPGNHEYDTKGAEGYYTYFSKRQPGSPGYYAFDLGRWRAYSVNGNCRHINCDKQVAWLKKDLSENPTKCSLIESHFPRYSSGAHGDNGVMRRFFRIANDHGVDLVLTGHDHHYERFRRMNHKGGLHKRGVMQFISGGGGKSHYPADGDATGSQFVEDDTFGVLRLVLRPKSFRFGFRGIDGSHQDKGARNCL